MELQLMNNEQTMSSLEIAKLTGKEHKNVLRDIKHMFEECDVDQLKTELVQEISSYTDKKGEKRPCYYLSKEWTLTLVSGYSTPLRKAIIDRWVELEGTKPKQLTTKEILAISYAEIQRLESLVEDMTPKAEFFDAVAECKDAVDIGTCAKVLNMGMGRNVIFSMLRRKSILMSNNRPYREFEDRGYFRVVMQRYTKPDGSEHVYYKTLVFPKGIDFIRKTLLED